MKKFLLLLFVVLLYSCGNAQEKFDKNTLLEPVKWNFTSSNTTPKLGDEVDLIFNAVIDDKYYIYGSDFIDLGPNPTELQFDTLNGVKLIGSLKCTTSKIKHDDVFDADIPINVGNATFKQRIKITSKYPKIVGVITGQTCTLKDGNCRLFTKLFDFRLFVNVSKTEQRENGINTVKPKEDTVKGIINIISNDSNFIKKDSIATRKGVTPIKVINKSTSSIWSFLLIAFGGGLLALMTPCVYPLIPMTVTFFVKASENKRKAKLQALFYSLSIIFIYTFIGLLVALLFGTDSLNSLSTSWYFNLLFFVVFFVFGMSFLGLFEITLPNGFINSVDAQSDKGGYLGVFFMAFALVLVSFSCTGPIAASLLAGAANGEFLRPILGMFAYSLAFAIPFGLFAIFPSWLSSLPKSGGWLNTVKVSLGFIELALAFKFFIQADLAYHWDIMSRELFIAIHVAISFIISGYLFGLFKMKNDSELNGLSVPRVLFATLFLIIAVYLLPGLFGSPLKALAGYLPPLHSQEFKFGRNIELDDDNGMCEKPKYGNILHSIEGIPSYFDMEQALACSKKLNKPIFIDFTGHGCANCRLMEENVFTQTDVRSMLRDKFVFVSLYVDDKTILPDNEWYKSKYDGRMKKSLGSKWADYQIMNFGVNAQPFYVILDTNGNKLTKEPYSFDLNSQNFLNFLNEGLINFNK